MTKCSMQTPSDFCPDLDEILEYLRLGGREGLASLHRAQDLQSFLMNRAAVRLLREDAALIRHVEANLSRWRKEEDLNSLPLLVRWSEIVAMQDWDAALANTDIAQQLRQASPLAGVLPHDTRLAIIRYVQVLKNSPEGAPP